MRVVAARRLVLTILACACLLGYGFGADSASASATTPFAFGGLGEEAGQFSTFVTGVATDVAGDVYVADASNERIDEFDGAGNFQLAWGVGVQDNSEQLQTCTAASGCRSGRHSTIAGGFEFPGAVAVDQTSGDVYVLDVFHARVEKFGPEGEFLLMFGGGVNKNLTAPNPNVCTKAEAKECQEGTQGTGHGAFSLFGRFTNLIAVGPGGRVYVGDSGRVEIFDESGVYQEEFAPSFLTITFEEEGRVEVFPIPPSALTVDSAGHVFLSALTVPGVHEFVLGGGSWTESATQFDTASFSVASLAVDGSSHLYVSDSEPVFHISQWDTGTGKELASFGSKTVSSFNYGMAFSDTAGGELYASDAENSRVWVVPLPAAGPLIDGESATPEPAKQATLAAQIDPEGNETKSCHFEYDTSEYHSGEVDSGANPPHGASVASSCPLTERLFEDQSVSAALTDLTPGETYHYRVVATDSFGHTTYGLDKSFVETPAVVIEGPWASSLTGDSVTLSAKLLNVQNVSTEYVLEYGTDTSYGHAVAQGTLGAGENSLLINRHIQELQGNTIYHYRVVATNMVGTVTGTDHTFTTQGPGGQLTLPDGRAWEMISPVVKGGSIDHGGGHAASTGGAFEFTSKGTVGEDPVGGSSLTRFTLTTRGSQGWQHQPANVPSGSGGSQDISVPRNLPNEGEVIKGGALSGNLLNFSRDLTTFVVEPPPGKALAEEALEGTDYLFDHMTGSITPLLTTANTPAGTKLGYEANGAYGSEAVFVQATPDLSHVLMYSPLKLTEDAFPLGEGLHAGQSYGNLYEWAGDSLRLVDILPHETTGVRHTLGRGEKDAELAGIGSSFMATRSFSDDGRWVAWTLESPYLSPEEFKGLFVRDMVAEETYRVGGPFARYQTMSSDGSRVFYLEGGDLRVFDTVTRTESDLTANHGVGETGAGVQESVSDVSEDGSYVYFVARGVLAAGAVASEDNLYLVHSDGASWEAPRLIATLSSADEPTWGGSVGIKGMQVVSSRVSPDGRYLAFMSQRSLTGYDNLDAVSGLPDEEVYLYDGATARLVCASCNPSGARPHGADVAKGLIVGSNAWSGHVLAGFLPHRSQITSTDWYQPNYLTNGGRLFFDSPDALAPQATNGVMNVFEYEPVKGAETPVTDGCAVGSSTFSDRAGGCVSLISSGTSVSESVFLDASENGDEAFFWTTSKLAPQDSDTAPDVYDAHACTTAVPCVSQPVAPPPCASGDACKAAPSPQPELFGAGPSETFNGAGNIVPARVVKARSLTRAQKLKRALNACQKKRDKRKRAACKRRARQRYGSRASRSRASDQANASKRGSK